MDNKFYFYYGVMGSSKTAQALMKAFNYETGGSKVLLCKPSIDNRDGDDIIKSRIGLSRKCHVIKSDCAIDGDTFSLLYLDPPDVIIIDECQFLTPEMIDLLRNWGCTHKVPIFCYGLKTDFQNKLFPGSKKLLEVATDIVEIDSACWCGEKATCNARLVNGEVVYNGNQVQIGGDESYTALCYEHYKKGKIHK